MQSAPTKTLLRIWIAFFWRATVIGFIVGALAGALVGMVLAASGATEHITIAASWAGYIVGVPVSMWAFVSALNSKFDSFEIHITRKENIGETFD